jgi:NADH-quinone oxidoreductase subunit G/NADP-reducing hydrogenase subunit HndD
MNIEINGKTYEAIQGETVLDALNRAGIKVPTLCHMKDLFPSGACRMCVVEVEGMPGLVPSCAYPAADGMKIKTHSPRAIRARKTIIELLLSNQPDDCLYCVRSGNCQLQTLANELGVRQRRYKGVKSEHKLDVSSPSLCAIRQCILCGRCVRVCEEIQGVSAIDFIGRGSRPRWELPSTKESIFPVVSIAASALWFVPRARCTSRARSRKSSRRCRTRRRSSSSSTRRAFR